MMESTPCIALLLAGGVGGRLHADCPKQFLRVMGKPLIAYTMEAFQRNPLVTDVYVVCVDAWRECVERVAADYGLTKFRQCFSAGDTSFGSLKNGVAALSRMGLDADSIVLVHEAVRPLVSQRVIRDNVEACRTFGNAITAVPSNESYARVDDRKSGTSNGYAIRDEYVRAQTPNTFTLGRLVSMFSEVERQGIVSSQSLFILANELKCYPLHIVQGDMLNFKITYPEDLHVLEALISAKVCSD